MAANPSAIGVRLLSTLVEKVPAEEVAEVIRDLMRATATVRTGSESFKEEVPDYRAREGGGQTLLRIYAGAARAADHRNPTPGRAKRGYLGASARQSRRKGCTYPGAGCIEIIILANLPSIAPMPALRTAL